MIAQINPLYIKTRPFKALKRFVSYLFFEGRPLTTKGRWLNPILFFLYSLIRKIPQFKKIKHPIYIIGTGRSGTTVLGIVLSMHKHVGFLNEPKALWHSIYPHEDVIGSYSRGDAHYRLGKDLVTRDVQKAANRLYAAFLTATFSKTVVDKYPELIFRTPFVKGIFPDSKFIFLVRNAWDTCSSIERWSERKRKKRKSDVEDWWGVNDRKWYFLVDQLVTADEDLKAFAPTIRNFTQHTDRALVEWILTMKQGIRLLEEMPGSILMVKFEELTHRPEKALRDISKFCDLPEDHKFIAYGISVLSPVPQHEPFDMHPCLKTAMKNTMEKLGYTVTV